MPTATTLVRRPSAPRRKPREERLEVDPFVEDGEDFVAFFRMLAVAVVVCSLAWLALGGVAVQLYGLAAG